MDGHTTGGMADETRRRTVDEFVENAAAIANDYPGPESAIASALCAVAYALLPEERVEVVDDRAEWRAKARLVRIEALLNGDSGDGYGDQHHHDVIWRVAKLLRERKRLLDLLGESRGGIAVSRSRIYREVLGIEDDEE